DARLPGLKIAVVGRVQRALEHLWSERLPSVKWLGYVADLDGVRNALRIAVCPDRGGTGISVKLLTALAAGQPVVVTSASLRGFPKAVAEFIPVADDPAAMGQDILRLLDDPAEARARRDCVERASRRLHKMSGYSAAIDLACVAPAGAGGAPLARCRLCRRACVVSALFVLRSTRREACLQHGWERGGLPWDGLA